MFLTNQKAPARVKWVPRLRYDQIALRKLFRAGIPPKRKARPSTSAIAVYQFGDASGSGFGSNLILDGIIYYRHGQWDARHGGESSNFRELANLIFAIEEAHEKGLLEDVELFVFTDNTTAEAAFHKGTSSSPKLFDLILRLRILEMHGNVSIHVIHVAGLRMIAQGTDGLVRGMTTQGVMRGIEFSDFAPLHLNAIERQGVSLSNWVDSWFKGYGEILWCKPEDWFLQNDNTGACVWTPAPSAAETAM